MQANQNIFTVSKLNAQVRSLLESEMGIVWLVGEISNLSMPSSGHWYLTLKDQFAQVKCAMFRSHNNYVTFKPANGGQVLVKARLSLYEPRGDYQIIIETMHPKGDGLAQQEFEALKQKLALEGLFDQAHKQLLPEFPQTIGIVTSATGAALFDILKILQRRDPSINVIIYPTLVQGDNAADSIIQAINIANLRQECDVLIVGRGGGSLEDLSCFNNETLARTIFSSKLPIISAVGHETDVTIADLIADIRASTPSAAAELTSSDREDKQRRYLALQDKLTTTMYLLLAKKQQQLITIKHKLKQQDPIYNIEKQANNLQLLEQRLSQVIEGMLLTKRHRFTLAMEKLDTVSPLSTLKRGYSITQSLDKKIITNVDDTIIGDPITILLMNGSISATITKIHKN